MTISKRSKMKHVLNTISSDYIGGKFENTAEGIPTEKMSKFSQKQAIEDEEECQGCLRDKISACFSTKMLHKRFPVTKWIQTYNSSYLLRDFIAGITVGLTAIPQGIAYANVAGLEPQYGLYSTIMPCFMYMIFGGCKDVTLGPTAIMALMTFPYASLYGPTYAVLLTFLSGIIILLLSLFQLGFLVDFISLPVTTGFTAAAAFTIASAQIKYFLGLNFNANGVDSWRVVAEHVDQIRLPDTLLGCCTILTLLFTRYLKNKASHSRRDTLAQNIKYSSLWLLGLSGNAIVVICGSMIAYSLTKDNVSPFILTGHVSGGLPTVKLPTSAIQNKTLTQVIKQLGSAVIAVPFISIMETIAIGKAFEKGKGVDATQEMIALGLSNLVGSFVSSLPISGSFTRSAVNNTSGVKTPLGGLFTGLLVLTALNFLTTLFYYIPKASLAGLIITAMIFMVEYHTIGVIWNTKKSDMLPLCTAFFSCLFFGIEVGMIIGIAANICFILYFTARPSMKITWLTVHNHRLLYVMPKQDLLFPAGAYFREVIIEECKKREDYSSVVIDGSHIYRLDSTSIRSLACLNTDLESRNRVLYLWKWNETSVRICMNFDEKLKKCFTFCNDLENIIHEPCMTNNDEFSTRDFSNAVKNEQSLNNHMLHFIKLLGTQ